MSDSRERVPCGKMVWGLRNPISVLDYSYHTTAFSSDECEKIRTLTGEYVSSRIMFEGEDNRRKSKNLWIIPQGNEWIYRRVVDCIVSINNSIYNYKLIGLESLQLTKYEVGDFYNTHLDISGDEISSDVQRKLSFSIQLSDESDYSGGELVFPVDGESIVKEKDIGTLISFPSYKAHRVTEVLSGARYSLVGWVLGPAFV